MNKKINTIFKEDYLFLFLLTVFISVKIPFLSLPYFWDEAWAYGNAVNHLYENGISLLPDAAPDNFTRGHPLLLHAIVAGSMKIFGQSPFVAHTVMLFICSSFLTVLYFSLKNFAGKFNALLTVVMLILLPAFFTQSVLVLSEIFLVFLSFLMYLSYQNNKKLLYVIFASLALLIKESAVVVLFVFIVLCIIENRKNFKKIFSADIIGLLLPFVLWSVYLIYQKSVQGWYFYPEHTSLISFSVKEMSGKFSSFSLNVFFSEGRFVWTLIVIAAFIYQFFIMKKQNSKNEIRLFLFSALLIFSYLLFSSLNFYSSRYVLIVSVCWLIVTVYYVTRTFRISYYSLAVIFIITGFYGIILWNLKFIGDTSPAYKNGVIAVQQITAELEIMNIYNEKIYAPFLIRENLSAPDLGYRTTENKFTGLLSDTTGSDFAVMDSYEEDEIRKSILNSPDWIVLKVCKVKNAEAFICKRISEPDSAGE